MYEVKIALFSQVVYIFILFLSDLSIRCFQGNVIVHMSSLSQKDFLTSKKIRESREGEVFNPLTPPFTSSNSAGTINTYAKEPLFFSVLAPCCQLTLGPTCTGSLFVLAMLDSV